MNYDRFLTRVFDKQQKKMVYVGEIAPPNCFSTFISAYYDDFRLVGIDEAELTVIAYSKESSTLQIFSIPFGDRYVPMMCTGSPDKNKKLIYAGDILRTPSTDDWDKINFASYEVFFHDNDSCGCHIGFRMNRVHYHGNVVGGSVPNFKPEATSRMEIIGNIHENEKLLEVKA